MIDLSAEQINNTPYKLEQVGTNSFVFSTKFGLRYNIGFTEDYTFLEEGVYQFYIVNLDHSHFKNDPLVRETIQSVIEAFFQIAPVTMLYICDMSDNRQSSRDRLFHSWFVEYSKQAEYTLINERVNFDGVYYFASIMLRKDHPAHDSIIKLFKDFISDLPGKIDQIQELAT